MPRESDGRTKINEYYGRGDQPLSIEQVEQTLSMHPWIHPPGEVIIMNGDFVTKEGIAVGVTPQPENKIYLSALADPETVVHELAHNSLGLGEKGTRLITPLLRMKERLTIFPRQVHYQLCTNCSSHERLFESTDPDAFSYPNLKHYRLVED